MKIALGNRSICRSKRLSVTTVVYDYFVQPLWGRVTAAVGHLDAVPALKGS